MENKPTIPDSIKEKVERATEELGGVKDVIIISPETEVTFDDGTIITYEPRTPYLLLLNKPGKKF